MASIFTLAEPILATGFAVGAAYLNLERFRYRNKIRNKARSLHDELSKKQGYDNYRDFREIKLIKYLSDLKDHDPMGDDNPSSVDGAMPKNAGLACLTYKLLYSKHFDRWACIITAGSAFLGLILGVTQSADLTNFSLPDGKEAGWKWFILVLSIIPCFLPLIFIKVGNWIVERLIKDAQEAYDRIAGVLKAGISEKAKLNPESK